MELGVWGGRAAAEQEQEELGQEGGGNQGNASWLGESCGKKLTGRKNEGTEPRRKIQSSRHKLNLRAPFP